LRDIVPLLVVCTRRELTERLRVSEATGADIEALGIERGHRS
jgi:hypothetical protein